VNWRVAPPILTQAPDTIDRGPSMFDIVINKSEDVILSMSDIRVDEIVAVVGGLADCGVDL
jgi:hypothetical protein